MNKYFKFIKRINFKSIYFNIKYLPFKQALKLPILVSKNVILLETKGKIQITVPLQPGMVQIGYGRVGIFDIKRSKSIWQVSGTVIFKGKANIGHGSKISVAKDAILELGDRFIITAESAIVTTRHIKFGNNFLMSWDCLIMDTDFHKILNNDGKVINSPLPIEIGNKVWIGCRSVIMKGSRIGDNSIIGANSLVSKDITAQSGIYVGNPVNFVKGGVSWEV